MAKRKDTLEIENRLHDMCRQKRIYGCEEVTIGFYNNGHGNEVVDFCTMDSKGILRCYEIKVTLADLKSSAKKSWYGHYNYLFVTQELYYKICEKLDLYIPQYVGVVVPCDVSWSSGIQVLKNAKKQELTIEQETMLKESMIRSMFYKMNKYKDSSDTSVLSKLKSELRKSEKDSEKWMKEATTNEFILTRLERTLRLYYGKDMDFQELMPEITHRNYILPEKIELFLNEKGMQYNERVEELRKIKEEME